MGSIRNYVVNNTHEKLVFRGLRFSGLTFEGFSFSADGEVIFIGCRFTDCKFTNSSFTNVAFVDECVFVDTEFISCKFSGSHFTVENAVMTSSSTQFMDCTFGPDTYPESSVFKLSLNNCRIETDESPFSCSTFNGEFIEFKDNSIKCETMRFEFSPNIPFRKNLGGLAFSEVRVINFSGLRFFGTFNFTQSLYIIDQAPSLYFHEIDFDSMSNARFLDVNLSKAFFAHSSLRKVSFDNCTWGKSQEVKYLHYDIFSESGTPRVGSRDDLTRLYVQLKNNYESVGDFVGAGDWYFREMEARLSKKVALGNAATRPFRRLFSANGLYRLVSSYGESYTKALGWIAVLLFTFAAIYQFSGFKLGDQYINYDLCPSCGVDSEAIYAFGKSIIVSLSVVILRVSKVATLDTPWTVLWHLLHIILNLAVIPLFLLALRRKFKR